jgi:hypothetical protein
MRSPKIGKKVLCPFRVRVNVYSCHPIYHSHHTILPHHISLAHHVSYDRIYKYDQYDPYARQNSIVVLLELTILSLFVLFSRILEFLKTKKHY